MPDPTPDPWDDRRWPTEMVLLAPLLAIVCPVPVARRLDREHLGLAYLVHLAGGLTATAAIFLLIAWAESLSGSGFAGILEELWGFYEDLAREIERRPGTLLAVVTGALVTFAFIEVVTLLVAWNMTAWNARAEPFGRSFRRSLARTWLITPHAVVYIVAYSGLIIWLDREYWYTEHQVPWLIRNSEILITLNWCFLTLLLIVTISRAFASGRWGAIGLWPTGCEGCGYNLVGLPKDGSCPECGKPRVESTTRSTRDRNLNQSGTNVTLGDWLWCSAMAIARPTALGCRLRTLSPTRGRGMFLLLNLTLVAAVATIGCTLLYILAMIENHHPDAEDIVPFLLNASISALIAWMIMLASASVVGTSARIGTKRNLLPLAMQGSLCLGGMLAIWTAIGWCVVVALYVLFDIIELRPRQAWGFDREVFFFTAMLGTPVLMLLSYLYWLGRITWAGRYANQ
ncbi:MAG: hypothetical protein GVY24_08340 [Planctomycetes bacterium]|jgi:hypothetical protein|nr:hypothetical protein [Planctomycetota bacterium]